MSNISFEKETIIINRIISYTGKSYSDIYCDLQTGYTTIKKLRRIAACIDMAEAFDKRRYRKTLVYDYISEKYSLSVRYIQELPNTHPQYFSKYTCPDIFTKNHDILYYFEKFRKKTFSEINYDLCIDYTDIKIINRLYACYIIKDSTSKKLDNQLLSKIKEKTSLSFNTIKILKTTYPEHFLDVDY